MNHDLQLDSIDKQIINILQKNGRITNVKLATAVGLSPPTVLERVRKLEDRGVIHSYVGLVDPEKIGRCMTAYVLVSLSFHGQQNLEDFGKEIMKEPEVLECYHVAGEGDFLLRIVVADIMAYRNFLVNKLTQMEGLQRLRTMIVFETLKRETAMLMDENPPSNERATSCNFP